MGAQQVESQMVSGGWGLAMLPFDRHYVTSYSPFMETIYLVPY